VHDGITFEKLNVPTLTICTDPFKATSESTARTLGLPEFDFALVAHPIGSRNKEELLQRAHHAYEQGIPILLGTVVN
jgi:hypothetical protein